jgi:hypothetical protein
LNIKNFDLKTNLKRKEILCLKWFMKNKPFKLVDLDKNIGIGIIDYETYDEIAQDLLSDEMFYLRLQLDPLNDSIKDIKQKLTDLQSNGEVSNELYKKIKPSTKRCRLGSFRVLPKLHKKDFSGRPIINCIQTPTSDICLLIDLILKPLISKTDSYLKDSQQLLQEAQEIYLPDKSVLYSCDFSSLYTNIDLIEAIRLIGEFLWDKFESRHINIGGILKLVEIVFKNNYFKYNNSFYKQIKGIAMGSRCGPSIANTVVYMLERSFLNIHRPIYYKRFIDDIFLIVNYNFNISFLINSFNNLKLNCVTHKIVNFLDLNISICPFTNTLKFNVYHKPTNTFQYLYCTSNHPKAIFKNIPKSLFIRLRRNCSELTSYHSHGSVLVSQLCERGFDFYQVQKIFFMVGDLDRAVFIDYKTNDQVDHNQMIIKNNFNFNFNNFNKIFKSSFEKIKENHASLENKKLMVANKVDNNLNSLILHGLKFDYTMLKVYKSKPCNKNGCQTCRFIDKNNFINLNGLILPLFCDADCQTDNVIYFIKCNLCDYFYIGETGRKVGCRISQHLYTIKNFSFKTHSIANYPVAFHFAIKPHDVKRDFSYFIFNKFAETEHRKDTEIELIYLFSQMNLKILNEKRNLIYYNKKYKRLFF